MGKRIDPIIVVGAGLAGLTCARELLRAGRRVLVLEAGDAVGGRVRTDRSPDGYTLDRGFQVILASYPALLRQISLSALSPRYFAAGLEIMLDGRRHTLGHPLYDWCALPRSLRAGLVTPADIAALAQVLVPALSLGDAPLPNGGETTRDRLSRAGMSQRFLDRVIAPFFGGISLDRSLASDATFFAFVLRSMVVGRVFLPAHGMQVFPETMARSLPPESLRLGVRVDEFIVEGGRVRAVSVQGEELPAEAVVVATDAPEAMRLTGSGLPPGKRSCTTVYFAGDRPLSSGKRLIVNGDGGLVNHLAQLSNVAPEYAPPGRHLLSATVIGDVEGEDAEVMAAVAADITQWFPAASAANLQPLHVARVPYAQFDQPPCVYETLPRSKTDVQGLFLAGEYLHSSSIQGALRGGELAAAAVLHGGVN